jgi:hypothetical protein
LLDDATFAAAFGAVAPSDETFYGRLGIGADVNLGSGKLSITSGVFANEDGYQGFDGGFTFAVAF